MTKSIEQWLDAYGESHQNPRNKIIHWVCVPIITWTVLALFWSVSILEPWLNLATLFMLGALIFYWRLSVSLMLGMAIFSIICLGLIVLYESLFERPLWQAALLLFVLAWIGQFIGHKIEGKKPSFFEDFQFLLIGPAWLLSFVYQKIGIKIS